MLTQTTHQQAATAAPECALCLRVAWHVTRLASVLVGLVRPLVRHRLADDDCERKGIPEGTSSPAVFCLPLSGGSRLGVGLWTELDAPSGQSCLHIRLLGCAGEVWFHPKR